jgi:hypothetical protein
MVRKTCLAAGLALLALAASRPAEAHPRFIEPYGRLWQARTFLCTPVDKRPKDALHAQASRIDDPRQRFIVSPFARDDDESSQYGIGAVSASLLFGVVWDRFGPAAAFDVGAALAVAAAVVLVAVRAPESVEA